MTKNLFGENLKKLREQNHLSRKDLSGKLNLSEQAVYYYETGKREPKFSTLIRLAELFEVSIDSLLRGEVEVSATDDTTIKIALPSDVDLGYIQESNGIVELFLTKFNKSCTNYNVISKD